MARIGQLKTLLEGLENVTVFEDGKMYDGCMRDRTFRKLPFIQLMEDVTDTSEHVGQGQNANYVIRGKYTHIRELDNNKNARANIISQMKENNLYHLKIEEARNVSAELAEIDFVVESFNAI